jgi:uncharacterized protein YcbX
MANVFLSKILIFPFKSLDPVEVNEVEITPKGTLKNDRRFALFREKDQKMVSKKWEPKLYGIHSRFDLEKEEIVFSYRGVERGFKFFQKRDIEKFFTDVLEYEVELKEDPLRGFPDDTEAYGPTVVARTTIIEVGSWFNLSEEESRIRLRTNLELDGENLPPFWEDKLYGKKGEIVWFKIGEVLIGGVNPCRRCPIPARDTQTGELDKNFRKLFEEMRRKTLPPWAERSRFDTYYRLTVNTIIPFEEKGKKLKLGDKFTLIGKEI